MKVKNLWLMHLDQPIHLQILLLLAAALRRLICVISLLCHNNTTNHRFLGH